MYCMYSHYGLSGSYIALIVIKLIISTHSVVWHHFTFLMFCHPSYTHNVFNVQAMQLDGFTPPFLSCI